MYYIICTGFDEFIEHRRADEGSTLQVDKIPVFIRTQMAVEWILSTVHTFRRENFLLV